MPSPDRHFANAAIFTHSASGITPNSGDAALYIKSDNKAYIKDSAGSEIAVVVSDTSAGSGSDVVNNIVSLTQAEYNAIGSPNPATLYLITNP